jgi:hypothetical protein
MRLSAVAFTLILLSTIALPQQNKNVFYIESWKKGERQIQEQKLTIELSTREPNYKTKIKDASGQERYKLVIRHSPLKKGGPNHNYWYVTLSDELGASPKYDLFQCVTPGPGKHYFPKEDYVAMLYPVEQPNIYKDVNSHYPMSAQRVIKVEGFYVIIRVLSYKFNEKSPKEVSSIKVEIEFTNKNQLSGNAAA